MPSSSGDERVQRALERYLSKLERGEKPQQAELLAEFADAPEQREQLQECLDGLDVIHEVLATESSIVPNEASISGTELAEGNEDLPQLGDFQLLRVLGRGGMGIVYEARQISLSRNVAVKVLPLVAELDSNLARRFAIEAQAVALLNHPHIVPILDVGVSNGIHYYAMELVDGTSLSESLSSHAPDECGGQLVDHREIARFGSQISLALQHAHDHGVIHRDVKPGNILLDRNGKIWLTDFGLARIDCSESLTLSGDILGTLQFMSPEQKLGKSNDCRTDVYSLGATLSHWLTHTRGNSTRTKLPTALATILGKAQETNSSERYQSAKELADDLERFANDQPIHAKRTPLYRRFLDAARSSRRIAIAAGVVCLAGVTAVLALSQAYQRDQDSRVQLAAQSERIEELRYANEIPMAYSIVQENPNAARDTLNLNTTGERRFEHALLDRMSSLPKKNCSW